MINKALRKLRANSVIRYIMEIPFLPDVPLSPPKCDSFKAICHNRKTANSPFCNIFSNPPEKYVKTVLRYVIRDERRAAVCVLARRLWKRFV